MKNGDINYLNYNSFVYDLPQIEEELGRIILSGKCLFKNKDNLNYVTYLGEGTKSEMMSKFYSKYPQTDLSEEEKDVIVQYIKTKKNENNDYDFKPIFISMQLIIFYTINNNFTLNDKISEILAQKPDYLKIEQDCLDFFTQEANDFKIDQFMNIFFLFEHLCFKDLCNNLDEQYKTQIEEETQKKITKLFSNNKLNDIISIKDFAAALRRYISRYLVGKKQKIEKTLEKGYLSDKLDKPDLWNEKIGKISNLKKLISKSLSELKLTVDKSYEFYQLIKAQDEEEIANLEEGKNDEPKPKTTRGFRQ